MHTSLDVVEEKLASSVTGAKAGPADTRELYLGSLHVSEHQKVTHQRLRVPCLTNQKPHKLCLPSKLDQIEALFTIYCYNRDLLLSLLTNKRPSF